MRKTLFVLGLTLEEKVAQLGSTWPVMVGSNSVDLTTATLDVTP